MQYFLRLPIILLMACVASPSLLFAQDAGIVQEPPPEALVAPDIHPQETPVQQGVAGVDSAPSPSLSGVVPEIPVSSADQSSPGVAQEGSSSEVSTGDVSVSVGQIPENAPLDAGAAVPEQEVIKPSALGSGVEPKDIPPVFFTFWEHQAILDAKSRVGFVNTPTKEDVERALKESAAVAATPEQERPKPPPEERELSLGGIVYTSKKDWVIWLNGQRILPDALPNEIIDLSVHKDYIEMKWLDDYTMQIFPVRLRAHQRFNLDTRIFLPG